MWESIYFLTGFSLAMNLTIIIIFEYFMGLCASSEKRPTPKTYSFACEPTGTDELKDKQLPKLLFHAVLANVKLKKYPYKKATAYFRVREGENFALATKNCGNQQSIAWRIHETFDFQMTEYELRKQFLEVSVLNEDSQEVASIKINLFLISTGPFHQDFALHFPSQKSGRISFDLKMAQIIELKIQSEESQIFLNKKHPGEEFCYSIKTINGFSGCSVQSSCSYPAVVLLENKSEDSRDISFGNEGLTHRKIKREHTQEIREGGELKWSEEGGELPTLETKVVASELHNTYFQIRVWKYQSELETSMELFVDSYVSFYKLLGTEPLIFRKGGIEFESRSIKIKEKVEQRGKDYGNGVFRFTILNQSYFKQYQLCVHSEAGILKTNPIFGIQETTSTDKCPELRDLLASSNSVEQHFITLNKLQTDERSRGSILELREVIEAQLGTIYKILEESSYSPIFFYTYSSERELLEGQKILVELGVKVTQYIESEDPIANDLCWLILISLLKRGEFSLCHMGLNDKQKKQIISNQLDELTRFKEEVAIMYKVFLYKLLDHALNSIDHRGSDYERTFAEIFSAYAYFRIPEFRKEILRLITKDTDPDIAEWRAVDFSLHEDIGESRTREKGNTFREMFDWEFHFYKYLRRNSQIESDNITLKEILLRSSWKERFIKRGLAFFYFIKYWVTYVDSTLPHSQDVQWMYFPGYNRLLRGFFVELKTRPILEYPDGLIEAALKLLVNEKLVNPIMNILISKVNVYDSSTVMRMIEYLNLILQAVGARLKQRLPLNFNYNIFFKTLSIIFEADFSIAVSAALTLVYSNFDLFHLQFRRSLSMYFLGSAFSRFFLHWSYNVRHIFYHLVTFKIYRDALYDDSGSTFHHSSGIENCDILNRYEDLIRLLLSSLKHYRFTQKINSHTSLHSSLFRKMKLRLLEQRQLEGPLMEGAVNKSFEEVRQSFRELNGEVGPKKNEKCHSDIWTQRKIKFQQRRIKGSTPKKEEIRRMSRSNEFTYKHEYQGKRSSLSYEIIAPSEFEMQDLEPLKLKLIQLCLPEFRKVEKAFMEVLEKGGNEAPFIKQEISIDKRQIRPKEFDDW